MPRRSYSTGRPPAGVPERAGDERFEDRPLCIGAVRRVDPFTNHATSDRSAEDPLAGWLVAAELNVFKHVLSLEVDILFFDTSSTYFETEHLPDELADADHEEKPQQVWKEKPEEGGIRRFSSHSKDHRRDLPQVVLGRLELPRHDVGAGYHQEGQGRSRIMGPAPGHLLPGPRLQLGGEPALPSAGRRALHRRREAPLRPGRGEGRSLLPKPLPPRRRQLRVKRARRCESTTA